MISETKFNEIKLTAIDPISLQFNEEPGGQKKTVLIT